MFIDIIIFIIFVAIALASSRNHLKQEEKRRNPESGSGNDKRYSTSTSHYSSATKQGARKDAERMRSTFEQAKAYQERKFKSAEPRTYTVDYSAHYNESLENEYYYQAAYGDGHDDMRCKYDSVEPPHGSHWWKTEPDELERLIKLNHEHEKHLMQRMVKDSDKDW